MGNKASVQAATGKNLSTLNENSNVADSRVAGFDLGVGGGPSDARSAPSSTTLSSDESSLSISKVSLDDFVLLKTVGKGSFVSL
jgi:hypothetical protein